MVPRGDRAVGSLPDPVVRLLTDVGLDDDYLASACWRSVLIIPRKTSRPAKP